MLRIIRSTAAAAALAAAAVPAAAQTWVPTTPNEQVGMHIGTTATNGSAVVVQDQNGSHPEGYPGMSVTNRASGDSATDHPRHHKHHHPATEPSPG
jgi:hypothetical protein